ncbi:hypothetical protein C900_00657 [Fulvivirga imtechensis AK7]|uniref:Uncharacterized protein n=1 Tax=Fulvivirga imtechensis AK7 TaxID=1237149 RepID=L8JH70_9BACT|nr:hypothetical protein C900_00657 [Fulvivirga imtechensis AK7]
MQTYRQRPGHIYCVMRMMYIKARGSSGTFMKATTAAIVQRV